MKEKHLIIIRGLPGSGKSSFASLIGKAICTADDYHIRNGIYNWKVENAWTAHSWCQKKCQRFMKAGINRIIIANTNTIKSEFEPYIKMAKEYGYKIYSIITENRHDGISIHKVPETTLERMKNRFDIKL